MEKVCADVGVGVGVYELRGTEWEREREWEMLNGSARVNYNQNISNQMLAEINYSMPFSHIGVDVDSLALICGENVENVTTTHWISVTSVHKLSRRATHLLWPHNKHELLLLRLNEQNN